MDTTVHFHKCVGTRRWACVRTAALYLFKKRNGIRGIMRGDIFRRKGNFFGQMTNDIIFRQLTSPSNHTRYEIVASTTARIINIRWKRVISQLHNTYVRANYCVSLTYSLNVRMVNGKTDECRPTFERTKILFFQLYRKVIGAVFFACPAIEFVINKIKFLNWWTSHLHYFPEVVQ